MVGGGRGSVGGGVILEQPKALLANEYVTERVMSGHPPRAHTVVLQTNALRVQPSTERLEGNERGGAEACEMHLHKCGTKVCVSVCV